ncbi:hypothetical protein CONLIGDRAFT_677757 [Coniochaeta ligniaria NRRL 30616]|uniref:Uncharacterized protein n=1 Tax=Coniochaeta ligniaria NRRL 30616 TaxID=1408157 RepID=A0A1J7J2P3_9PEZI|nr:hypothetical protein CONLIGDRAFT_677757 [Coniochaeta ligniaria NRRL 30616]
MLFNNVLTALAGLSSLAVAAPASAERDATPVEKGLKYRSKAQRRSPLIIQETVVEQSITIVQNQNLGLISQLAAIAEQELAALVQSQVALVTQLEEIKNNIRINHFKAKFSQVNTVIVTVTNVIDARDPANINKRYLLNQLLADNGAPDKQFLVMVSQAQEMTIGATPTVDLSGILGTAASASILSTATSSPVVAGLDPSAPFGLFNGSLILPYNTSTPSSAVVFEDPANIIFLNNNGASNSLFVESAAGFQSDCASFVAQQNSFLNLAALQLFSSVEQAAAAQLAAIQLGTALPLIPPSVLAGNSGLAAALAGLQGSAASSSSSATATSAAAASATADTSNEG